MNSFNSYESLTEEIQLTLEQHSLLFFLNLFIFGCVGSSLLRVGFSLVAASGDYSSLQCAGFSLR